MARQRPEVRKERPDRKADLAKDLSRLKGMSRSDLARDDLRAASSPLGHGMGSKKIERKKGI